MIKHYMFLFFILLTVGINSQSDTVIYVAVNETAIIKLPQVANYRRVYGYGIEDIFRVCNGKNKKTCGYWENVESKKKVPSGATSYDKNQKALVIKKFRETDFGDYMTGNKKQTKHVLMKIGRIGK